MCGHPLWKINSCFCTFNTNSISKIFWIQYEAFITNVDIKEHSDDLKWKLAAFNMGFIVYTGCCHFVPENLVVMIKLWYFSAFYHYGQVILVKRSLPTKYFIHHKHGDQTTMSHFCISLCYTSLWFPLFNSFSSCQKILLQKWYI